MTELISSDARLSVSPAETEQLQRLLAAMIPGDGDHPAGNAPEILAGVLEKLNAEPETARLGLQLLVQLGSSETDATDPLDLLESLREQSAAFATLLQNSLLTSYYQHPAVLSAIGVAPRPPFPEGREVADTNWSLLEAVQQRSPFYRKV